MTTIGLGQRDYMRRLVSELGRNKLAVCSAYAQAEQDGIVVRHSNTTRVAPADYANALWEDGAKKGWLSLDKAPSTTSLKELSVAELLLLHAQVGEELVCPLKSGPP